MQADRSEVDDRLVVDHEPALDHREIQAGNDAESHVRHRVSRSELEARIRREYGRPTSPAVLTDASRCDPGNGRARSHERFHRTERPRAFYGSNPTKLDDRGAPGRALDRAARLPVSADRGHDGPWSEPPRAAEQNRDAA